MAGSNEGSRIDRRIDEEVRFHIEGRTEELMAAGLTREEAERRAMAAFGDVERVRMELRTIDETMERRTRRREWIWGWIRDLRMAARRLLRSPGYAVVALLTLGLGIGASVAMFTVLNAVVLRPLPYAQPDRLVHLWPAMNMNITLSRELASAVPSISSYTGWSRWGLTLTGEGSAAVVDALAVDAGYFDTFGVRPVLGRAFLPEETEPARSGVVILSWDMWQTRFGGDAGVIGKRISLSGSNHSEREVIGVMPADHRVVGKAVDVWIPLSVATGRTVATDSTWYVNAVVGRMVPGATVERVASEVGSAAERLRSEYPGRIEEEMVRQATAVGLLDSVVGDVRVTLWLMLAAVGLVLLIACANLANLALARASGQRRELAVQVALGASRSRLIRHQTAESALVAVLGGVTGALLSRGLLAMVRLSDTAALPRTATLGSDWRVLSFAIFASAAALVLFGVWPAVLTTRGILRGDLDDAARGGSRGRRTHRLNRALVTGEIALATLLTTAAALVLSSFSTLRSTAPGIDTSDVLAVTVLPQSDRFTGEMHTAYVQEVTSRLNALPGVSTVGSIHLLPFTDNNWSFPYLAEDHPPPEDGPLPSANFRLVTPHYFEAVDQPIERGRDLTDADRVGSPRVVLINHTFAESLWPGEDPIGRTIAIFGSIEHEVVGVVGDVHQHALDLEPLPEMYVPMAQWNQGGATVVFMVEGPGAVDRASEIREIVASYDPDVPITGLQPLAEALDASLARRRFIVMVLAAFGFLALLLGGIGVHGVSSNLVGARMSDFGIQLALGASPRDIRRDALVTGVVPALAGLLIGGLAALAARGVITRLTGETSTVGFAVFAVVVSVLLLVSLAASWLPARRAGRADPLEMLRTN